jgi:hypothetical protein
MLAATVGKSLTATAWWTRLGAHSRRSKRLKAMGGRRCRASLRCGIRNSVALACAAPTWRCDLPIPLATIADPSRSPPWRRDARGLVEAHQIVVREVKRDRRLQVLSRTSVVPSPQPRRTSGIHRCRYWSHFSNPARFRPNAPRRRTCRVSRGEEYRSAEMKFPSKTVHELRNKNNRRLSNLAPCTLKTCIE